MQIGEQCPNTQSTKASCRNTNHADGNDQEDDYPQS